MPGQPNDETRIFNEMTTMFRYKIEERNDAIGKVLTTKFPELIKADGSVDPTEALITLVDKTTEIDSRLKGVEQLPVVALNQPKRS